MDCSLPGLSVGILQARILEWVAMPSSRDLPNPGIKPRSSSLQADSLPTVLPGKPLEWMGCLKNTDTLNKSCTNSFMDPQGIHVGKSLGNMDCQVVWTGWARSMLSPQSCLTLWDPIDCGPPGYSVHRIFQARILEWLPCPSPTQSCLFYILSQLFLERAMFGKTSLNSLAKILVAFINL